MIQINNNGVVSTFSFIETMGHVDNQLRKKGIQAVSVFEIVDTIAKGKMLRIDNIEYSLEYGYSGADHRISYDTETHTICLAPTPDLEPEPEAEGPLITPGMLGYAFLIALLLWGFTNAVITLIERM